MLKQSQAYLEGKKNKRIINFKLGHQKFQNNKATKSFLNVQPFPNKSMLHFCSNPITKL